MTALLRPSIESFPTTRLVLPAGRPPLLPSALSPPQYLILLWGVRANEAFGAILFPIASGQLPAFCGRHDLSFSRITPRALFLLWSLILAPHMSRIHINSQGRTPSSPFNQLSWLLLSPTGLPQVPCLAFSHGMNLESMLYV